MNNTFPSVRWHVCEREGKQKGCVSSARAHRGESLEKRQSCATHSPLCVGMCVSERESRRGVSQVPGHTPRHACGGHPLSRGE
jgi:hypothetical protein